MRENRQLLLVGSTATFSKDPFVYARDLLNRHLSQCRTLGYIPYAEDNPHYGPLEKRMRDVLLSLDFIMTPICSSKALSEIDGLVIGNGNAHRLLAWLDTHCPIGNITERLARGMPYVGFGTGALLAGWSIQHAEGGVACHIPSPQAIHAINVQIAVGYDEESCMDLQIEHGHADCPLPVYALYPHTIIRVMGSKGQVANGTVAVFRQGHNRYFIDSGAMCLPAGV